MQDGWRILIVEDDLDGQEVVATVLEHLNIAFDVASDAEQAEDLLFEERIAYNGVIVDLALPGKDGWELLSAIQNHPATNNVPCIAITAYHSSKTREEALHAGFTAYFSKPLDTTNFARRLEELL